MKFYFKIFSIIGLCLIFSVYGYPVFAGQDNQSLYVYFMNTFGYTSYFDSSLIEEKIKYLEEEYNSALAYNIQGESYENIKKYAEVLEDDINFKIDNEVELLRSEQDSVVSEVKNNLLYLSRSELLEYNSKFNILQDSIDKKLLDKTSLSDLFVDNDFNKIDTSKITESINEYKQMIDNNSFKDAVNLGELNNLRRPFDYDVIVTSNAGYRTDPINYSVAYHNATDYAMPIGTNLYSLFNGRVILAGNTNNGYGNNIKIDCGDGIILHYAHLSEIYVEVGDYVSQNQLIGKSGNTGRSTGPHLHLGLEYDGIVLSVERLFNNE